MNYQRCVALSFSFDTDENSLRTMGPLYIKIIVLFSPLKEMYESKATWLFK